MGTSTNVCLCFLNTVQTGCSKQEERRPFSGQTKERSEGQGLFVCKVRVCVCAWLCVLALTCAFVLVSVGVFEQVSLGDIVVCVCVCVCVGWRGAKQDVCPGVVLPHLCLVLCMPHHLSLPLCLCVCVCVCLCVCVCVCEIGRAHV